MPIDFRGIAVFTAFVVIAVRLGLIGGYRRYPFFVLYLFASSLYLVGALASQHLLLPDQPSVYVASTFVLELILSGAAVLMLLWLHYLPARAWMRRDWPILAFAAIAIVMEIFSSPESHWVLRFTRAMNLFRGLLGVKAFIRCFDSPGFSLGRNLTGALLGEVVPTLFLVIGDSLYLSHLMPYESWFAFASLVYVIAWGYIAWSMWDLDTPQKTE